MGCLITSPLVETKSTTTQVTFLPIGKPQTFKIPNGVTVLYITATGGCGGGNSNYPKGCYVETTLLVEEVQTLTVVVGLKGEDTPWFSMKQKGGFGFKHGDTGSWNQPSGGGSSAIIYRGEVLVACGGNYYNNNNGNKHCEVSTSIFDNVRHKRGVEMGHGSVTITYYNPKVAEALPAPSAPSALYDQEPGLLSE